MPFRSLWSTHRHWAVAIILSLVTSLVMLRDGLGKLSDHLFVAVTDPSFCAWTLERVRQNLARDPLHLFDGKIFFPTEWTVAFSDHLLGLQPLYIIIRLFTPNVTLSLNILVILSTVLCFLSMYAYLFSRLEDPGAAIFGATLFAFAIPRLAQFGHVQLLTLFYMPLALLAVERMLATKKVFCGILFVILAILQSLSSYYLAYPFLIYAFIHALHMVWSPPAERWRNLKTLLICFVAIGCVIAFFSWPYLLVNRAYENRNMLGEVIRGSADLAGSYLSVPVHNQTWWSTLNRFQVEPLPNEKWLFMGATCYGLVGVAVALIMLRRHQRDPYSQSWLLGAFALFLLSFGPFLVINGKQTAVCLPYLLLYYALPGFSSLTVPARNGLVLVFPLTCLASLALATSLRALRHRRFSALARYPMVAGLTAATLWESRTVLPAFPFPVHETIPACYQWLRDQKLDGGVLDWPVGGAGFGATEYMHFHLWSGKATVAGYSGFIPSSSIAIPQHWESPRIEGLRYLDALGISTIVYHKLRTTTEHQSAVASLVSRGFLKLIYSDKETDIYSVAILRKIAGDLSLEPMLPDYADTVIPRSFAVRLQVTPEDAVWLNPLGREGVCGEVIYTAEQPLRSGTNLLVKRTAKHNGIAESLKVLPIAALNGEVAMFSYVSIKQLNSLNSTDLMMQWDFKNEFRPLRSLTLLIRDPKTQRREYRAGYNTDHVRVSASHNSADITKMFDGSLQTYWWSGTAMAPGMFLELEPELGNQLDGFCLWLGANYIDYPTIFRIQTADAGGILRDVSYRFNIVGQPDRPNENRLEVRFTAPLSKKVRMEIIKPPPEGSWAWSVSELQPFSSRIP